MTRQLENRITELADRIDVLEEQLAELETFRAWVLDPDADEDYELDGAGTALDRTELDALGEPTVTTPDDEPADEPEVIVTDRDGGGWRTVRNTVTGDELRVQGHEAEAEAIRELTS